MKSNDVRTGCRTTAMLFATAALSGIYPAQACDGPLVQSSRISINAVGANLRAEGSTGSTKTVSFLGFRSKKSTAPMPGEISVGTVEVGCNAQLVGSSVNIDVVADHVQVVGSRARIGSYVQQ
jgi:hypothetical protein